MALINMNLNEFVMNTSAECDQGTTSPRLFDQLKVLSQQPKDTFLHGFNDLLQEHEPWYIEHAINTCDHVISDLLLNDETVNFLLDNNIRPYLIGMAKYDFMPETIRLVLQAHPESIYHLPDELITYEMAVTVVKADPTLFQSLPERFRTLDIARSIYPSPGNYYHVPREITEQIFELWLKGDFVFKEYAGVGKTKIIGKPNCAYDVFELYRSALDSDRMNNQLEVMFAMTPVLLAKFNAADCWDSARNDTEKSLVVMTFGKEHLINHASVDNRRKRDWLEDGLSL
jgi:hypothetical protein